MVKEVKFTKKDYEELLNSFTKDYMKLVKWLIEKYPKIWHQYEKQMMNGKRIMFLKELDKFVDYSKEVHKVK